MLPRMFLSLTEYLPFVAVPAIIILAALAIFLLSRRERRKRDEALASASVGDAFICASHLENPASQGPAYLCGHCQRPISRQVALCPFCGAKICQQCHTFNDADARFCGNCGQQI
jgi:RNA polymerase subunit RPABC4/transcription elongation factor Spt4